MASRYGLRNKRQKALGDGSKRGPLNKLKNTWQSYSQWLPPPFFFFQIKHCLPLSNKLKIGRIYTSIKPAMQLHIRGTNLDCLLKSTRSFSLSMTNIMTTCCKENEPEKAMCGQYSRMGIPKVELVERKCEKWKKQKQ